jgi:hypothetical protein
MILATSMLFALTRSNFLKQLPDGNEIILRLTGAEWMIFFKIGCCLSGLGIVKKTGAYRNRNFK